jgi:hypothetical protein
VQKGKRRLREGKWLASGHPASQTELRLKPTPKSALDFEVFYKWAMCRKKPQAWDGSQP